MISPDDITNTKKTIAELEKRSEQAKEFLATDFGKYFLKSLDILVDEYTARGESLTEQYPLRSFYAAKGARAAKEVLMYPIKQTEEGGMIEVLRQNLRNSTGQ